MSGFGNKSSDTLGSRTSLPVLTDLQVSNYNYFDNYRRGNLKNTSADVDARGLLQEKYWRKKYAEQASDLPSAAEAVEALFAKEEKIKYGRPNPPFFDVRNEEERAFLQQRITLPEGQANWEPIRILGKGGGGRCGLWQYKGPDPNYTPRQIVIKQVPLSPDPDKQTHLHEEFHYVNQFDISKSKHFVKLAFDGKFGGRNEGGPILDAQIAQDEGLPPQVHGQRFRLWLEYCPLGTLADFLERRMFKGTPLFEITIWRIFDCLADALAVMEKGQEAEVVTEANGELGVNHDPLPSGWNEKIHFDMKPTNTLLKERDEKHTTTPIVALMDFGATMETLPGYRTESAAAHDLRVQSWRRLGTPGYFAPEQFTERWEWEDWKMTDAPEKRIAGAFSAKTNVWGVGCIMQHLVRLTPETVDHKFPFTPFFQINKEKLNTPHTKKKRIETGIYSQALTDLIYECLYENPLHRPGAQTIKLRVALGIQMCLKKQPSVIGESWEDFVPPDPMWQDEWNRRVAEEQRLERERLEREAAARLAMPPPPTTATGRDRRPRGRSRSPDNQQRRGRGDGRERSPRGGSSSRSGFGGDGAIDERIATKKSVVRSRFTPAPVRDERILGRGVVAQVPDVIPGLGEEGEEFLVVDDEGDVGMRGT